MCMYNAIVCLCVCTVEKVGVLSIRELGPLSIHGPSVVDRLSLESRPGPRTDIEPMDYRRDDDQRRSVFLDVSRSFINNGGNPRRNCRRSVPVIERRGNSI